MSRRRSTLILPGLTIAAILGVAWAAFEQRRSAHPGAVENSAAPRGDRIDYVVRLEEWPGERDPTYCDIVRRAGLTRGQITATLRMNGGNVCVDGLETVPRGQTVSIALEEGNAATCPSSANLCN